MLFKVVGISLVIGFSLIAAPKSFAGCEDSATSAVRQCVEGETCTTEQMGKKPEGATAATVEDSN